MVYTLAANLRLLWFSYRVVVETSGRTSVPNSKLSTPPRPRKSGPSLPNAISYTAMPRAAMPLPVTKLVKSLARGGKATAKSKNKAHALSEALFPGPISDLSAVVLHGIVVINPGNKLHQV